MKQVALDDWPKGLFFQLLMIPDDLVDSLGLSYEAYQEDGLGLHFAAIVDVPKGPFAVRRGVHYPGEGTQIWCMDDGQPVPERIQDFLDAFDLDENVVIWRSPYEITDHRSAYPSNPASTS